MGLTGTTPEATSADTPSLSTRLRAAKAATGLSAAELGVARLYAHPHSVNISACVGEDDQRPVAGVEILVKDLQQVAGEIVTFGSASQSLIPAENDATVNDLLSQGATLVGASVSAEFGATVYTESAASLNPVNPVDAKMTAGGSSSGAAVAVARGIANIAHANDGGGSIRVPAASVGLPGLKPAHCVINASELPDFTAQGFIAADLRLTAQAYGLATAHTSQTQHAPPALPNPSLRIGMTTTPFHGDPGQSGPTSVDPRITAATTAASALLLTHPQVSTVTPVPAPYPVDRFTLFSRIMAARCAALPEPLGPMPGWLKARGKELTPDQIADAAASIAALPQDILQRWPEVDVVITPTLACAPPRIGAFSALSRAGAHRLDFLAQTAWTPWASLWNLTGWAGLSLPLVEARPGHWPISVHLGAVSDRVDATTLITLGTHLQHAVAKLFTGSTAHPMDWKTFTISEPGDIETLRFRPVSSGRGHGNPHGNCHGSRHDH